MTDPIKLTNLARHFERGGMDVQALRGVDLAIEPGEFVALVGPSGSGKSTLLNLLGGLDRPSTGELWLDGTALHTATEADRTLHRRQRIGFIFQSFMLVQSLTALENVMLPAEIAGLDNPKALALDILEQVGLKHRAHHFPNQLSGGEQQRVAIARAFITSPKILFADEPTGNLDAKNSEKIEALLFEMNREKGTTLVLVTHDNELAEHCDRQLTMNAGELIETTGANIMNNKEAV